MKRVIYYTVTIELHISDADISDDGATIALNRHIWFADEEGFSVEGVTLEKVEVPS